MRAEIPKASFTGDVAWDTGLYPALALGFACQSLDFQAEAWAASPDFEELAVKGKPSAHVLFPLQ